MRGHMNIINYLTEEKYCDPLCTAKDGYTSLHWAASYGQLKAVQHLVQGLKCPANFRNSANQTPLDLARGNGHTDVVKYLESFV